MEELSVITIAYEVYKKLLILNTQLDKKYRYTLGEQALLNWSDVMRQILLAKSATKPSKANYLIIANAQAELTAFQLRAMLELNLANETNVFKLNARISEARRQIGGWHRSVK